MLKQMQVQRWPIRKTLLEFRHTYRPPERWSRSLYSDRPPSLRIFDTMAHTVAGTLLRRKLAHVREDETRPEEATHRMKTTPTSRKSGLDHGAMAGDRFALNCSLYQEKGFVPAGALERRACSSGE